MLNGMVLTQGLRVTACVDKRPSMGGDRRGV